MSKKQLRILCCNPSGGAFVYITNGYGNAFQKLGHKFKRWDGNIDVWNNFNPDIYICASGHKQSIPSNHRAKLAIHVNPYCKERLQVSGGPLINESNSNIDWVVKQKPSIVFGYANKAEKKKYFYGWGDKFLPMPNAGDSTIYKEVEPVSKYECDVGWIGGYWKYKAMTLDKYIKPLIKKFNCAIYGWGNSWGKFGNGEIKDSDVNSLYSSVKIAPAISEPHTQVYGIDLPERVFKASIAGAFVIADNTPSIRNYFGEELPIAKNPGDLIDKIKYYLKHEDEREELRKLQKERVLNNHTYIHRIKNMLNTLGYKQ